MSKLYAAPERMTPLVKEVHDTLLTHCERDVRVKIELPIPEKAWIKVLTDPRQQRDGILRTDGGIDDFTFKLYTNPVSACMVLDDARPDAAQLFYFFIQLLTVYRHNRGLPPMNTHILYGLAAEDSPPVNAQNYAALPPDHDGARLAKLIAENFNGISFSDQYDRLGFYIFSGASRLHHLPVNYAVIATKLRSSFISAFPDFKTAKLFAVRWIGTQYLYFVTQDGKLYYCTSDGSRDFLESRIEMVSQSVLKSSLKPEFKSAPGRFVPAGLPVQRFRFTIDDEGSAAQ